MTTYNLCFESGYIVIVIFYQVVNKNCSDVLRGKIALGIQMINFGPRNERNIVSCIAIRSGFCLQFLSRLGKMLSRCVKEILSLVDFDCFETRAVKFERSDEK